MRPCYKGLFAAAVAVLASLGLASCGGGGGDGTTPSPTSTTSQMYSIGGTITGVTGSGLVLQNNGGDDQTVTAGARSFTFSTGIVSGGAYSVTIKSAPTNETCSVTSGSGTVSTSNVTSVAITCQTGGTSAATYTIGGTISGLTASGLVLQDAGSDDLTVAAGATAFTFPNPLSSGKPYSVTVQSAPANTTCSVTNASGTVGTANITNVAITCKASSTLPATYTIGGTLTNLAAAGLVLQDNNGDNLTVNSSGLLFTFATPLTAGSKYAVTVLTQPQTQTCMVSNGTGTVASSNITSINVSCVNVGQFVYVVNATDTTGGTNGNVSQFAIDPSTGSLAAVDGGRVAAGTEPIAIAINRVSVAGSPLVYVANATSADITTFFFSPVSGNGFTAGALEFSDSTGIPGGTPASIVFGSSAVLFVGGSGAASQGAVYGSPLNQVGDLPPNPPTVTVASDGPVAGMVVAPSSALLFATTSVANRLDVYSIGSGVALTAVGGSPYATGNDPQGVAVWPKGGSTGGFVYTANRGDSTISAFSYNGAGSLSPATSYSTGQAPVGITIDPTGTYLYTANSGDGTVSAFLINQSTGALTALGSAVASGNLNPTLHSNPGPVALELEPSGKYLYCVNRTDGSVSQFTVTAGALKLSNTYASGAGAGALAVY
jgi:6-phosphogluconolactonase (cycloisomerase 2 family)